MCDYHIRFLSHISGVDRLFPRCLETPLARTKGVGPGTNVRLYLYSGSLEPDRFSRVQRMRNLGKWFATRQ